MNLIEIAEDLKDVPDQYLMQEIQQPTGNFPAYLVVSELSRRKRMRDKVAKEMPSQTVAQELATPPQPQMAPQMDPQMAPQGLMAMPQAQTELAAQDAMGTTPPEMMMPAQMMPQMAGGGIVSFRDGGDVPRFQNQGLVNVGLGDTFDGFSLPMGDGVDFEFPTLTDEQKLEYIQGRVGYPQIAALREGTISLDEIFRNVYRPPSTTTAPSRVPPRTAPAASAGAPPAPPAPPPSRDIRSAFAMPTPDPLPEMPSPYAIQTARAQRESDYAQAVPDRLTPFLKEAISKREGDIKGLRDSNINQALIRAGLEIADKGIIKGAGKGLDAYQQGAKDIRQSEEALLSARAKMMESQSLRDQNKFKAADEAEKQAREDYKIGLDRANTKNAMDLRNLQAEMAARKLPAEIGLLEAQADYARSGGRTAAADQKAADDYAKSKLLMSGILPNSPDYMTQYANFRNEYLTSIAGGGGVTQIPVAPAGGAGGARFVGFEGS